MRIRALRFAAVAVGLTLGASPVLAQQASTNRQLQVIGTAPTGCLMGALSAANPANMTFAVGSTSSGTVGFAQFVELNSLRTLPGSIDLVLPITCNAAHRIEVRSANGGLLRAGAASPTTTLGGFGQFVAYSYRAAWLGQTYDQASNAGLLTVASDQAAKGDFGLRVSSPAGTGPLAAGQYADTITIDVFAAN